MLECQLLLQLGDSTHRRLRTVLTKPSSQDLERDSIRKAKGA